MVERKMRGEGVGGLCGQTWGAGGHERRGKEGDGYGGRRFERWSGESV